MQKKLRGARFPGTAADLIRHRTEVYPMMDTLQLKAPLLSPLATQSAQGVGPASQVRNTQAVTELKDQIELIRKDILSSRAPDAQDFTRARTRPMSRKRTLDTTTVGFTYACRHLARDRVSGDRTAMAKHAAALVGAALPGCLFFYFLSILIYMEDDTGADSSGVKFSSRTQDGAQEDRLARSAGSLRGIFAGLRKGRLSDLAATNEMTREEWEALMALGQYVLADVHRAAASSDSRRVRESQLVSGHVEIATAEITRGGTHAKKLFRGN
jgi:hypothetical protein